VLLKESKEDGRYYKDLLMSKDYFHMSDDERLEKFLQIVDQYGQCNKWNKELSNLLFSLISIDRIGQFY